MAYTTTNRTIPYRMVKNFMALLCTEGKELLLIEARSVKGTKRKVLLSLNFCNWAIFDQIGTQKGGGTFTPRKDFVLACIGENGRRRYEFKVKVVRSRQIFPPFIMEDFSQTRAIYEKNSGHDPLYSRKLVGWQGRDGHRIDNFVSIVDNKSSLSSPSTPVNSIVRIVPPLHTNSVDKSPERSMIFQLKKKKISFLFFLVRAKKKTRRRAWRAGSARWSGRDHQDRLSAGALVSRHVLEPDTEKMYVCRFAVVPSGTGQLGNEKLFSKAIRVYRHIIRPSIVYGNCYWNWKDLDVDRLRQLSSDLLLRIESTRNASAGDLLATATIYYI